MDTTTNSFSSLQKRTDANILGVYAKFPVAFVKGSGRYLWDVTGEKYLDFGGGIAVNSLGHAHPRIVETLAKQASQLIHTSNLYYTEPAVRLAERLNALFGAGRCFFTNSGVEANEGLFKLARRFGQESEKFEIITTINSFHGRTLGGIAATGQEKIKAGFNPIIPGFVHVPYNDLPAAASAVNEKTAAILIEGVQGEGGILPATPEYLLGLRKLCDQKGILLFMDAVQCGHFRTGRFQSYERILEGRNEAFLPDAVSYAKSLGGGFPIGGIWVRESLCQLLGHGSHGTTYGGGPLACSVANTVLDVIEEENLAENARSFGEKFKAILNQFIVEFPELLQEVRGFGCILGLEIKEHPSLKDEKLTPAQVLLNRLMKEKLLVIPSGSKVLRFLPPLNTIESEMNEAAEILKIVFQDISK